MKTVSPQFLGTTYVYKYLQEQYVGTTTNIALNNWTPDHMS